MRLRVPSIQAIGTEIVGVARRFPAAVALIAVGAVCAQLMFDSFERTDVFLRLLMTSILGLPVAIAVALRYERDRNRTAAAAGYVALFALMIWVYIGWVLWSDEVGWRRVLQLKLATLLSVASIPFVGVGRTGGFWQYNRFLFMRFLQATVYAGVLMLGISLLIAALDQLFGLPVDEEIYPRLWVVLITVFHPLFVLGGFPKNIEVFAQLEEYPRPLRILAQYILLPLVTAYLLTLLAYLIKVVFTADWPSGWIGYLVSAVAVAGMLSLLLLHPIAERRDEAWVARYRSLYYLGMLPALGMLLVAIAKRVGQYGITENRYFLLVLALWMLGLCLANLVGRWRDIRWIPVSLGLVAVLTSFGPWSAYGSAQRSQVHRLEELLSQVRATNDVDLETRRELSSVLYYLRNTHGLSSLRSPLSDEWATIEASLDSELDDVHAMEFSEAAMKSLGLEYVHRWQAVEDGAFSFWAGDHSDPVDLRGFHTFWQIDLYSAYNEHLIESPDFRCTVQITAGNRLELKPPIGRSSFAELDSVVVDARELSVGSDPDPPLYVDFADSLHRYRLELQQLGVNANEELTRISGRLYVGDFD